MAGTPLRDPPRRERRRRRPLRRRPRARGACSGWVAATASAGAWRSPRAGSTCSSAPAARAIATWTTACSRTTRRAPGHVRGLQGRPRRRVPRPVGRHVDAVHAPLRRAPRRRGEDGATPPRRRRPARLAGGFLAADPRACAGACATGCARARCSPRRCCTSTSGASTDGLPDFPGRARAPSPSRASRPRSGTTSRAGRACAGASWPCAPGRARADPAPRPRRRREPTTGPGPARSTAPACARTSSTARRCARRSSTRSSTPATTSGSTTGAARSTSECDYTLDQVARYDHPALIAAVLRETGRADAEGGRPLPGLDELRHGRAGGLVPEVTDVVTNAVSLHVDVTRASKLRMQVLVPLLAVGDPGFDPQWAIRPTACAPAASHLGRALVRRECDNPVCPWRTTPTASADVLWGHANLTRRRTAGSAASSAGCRPRSSARCRAAPGRHLVAADDLRRPARRPGLRAAAHRPRFTLLAGAENRCFLPRASGARTRG